MYLDLTSKISTSLEPKKRNECITTPRTQFVGERVDRARKRKRLTRAELARRSGVSQRTITRIIAGFGGMRADTLYRISVACDVSMNYFYIGAPGDE